MFTVRDEVENKGSGAVTLYPYSLVSRWGKPHTQGYYVLHEGMIGYLGNDGLQEFTYDKLAKEGAYGGANTKGKAWNGVTGGFVGITDKYWAAAAIPDQDAPYTGAFTDRTDGTTNVYQASVRGDAVNLAAGASATSTQRLFAGAKEVNLINNYEKDLGIKHFDLMIDWGWFFFITKPMFRALDFFYHLFGNFGVSILVVTFCLKLLFLPIANRSYVSMAKMKAVQPEMAAIRERYKDDRMKQQQATMELYKKEKINPVAGCWPVLIQIPVFFALYKVLFITIEMRHAPFFGWIHDLAAPGSDEHRQPVRPAALPGAGLRPSGRLAADHGRDHVRADEDEPRAAGPGPGADLHLHADRVHLHAGVVPGRPRDLLGLEQHPVGDAAIRHHAAQRREGGAVGQPAEHVPARRRHTRRPRPRADGRDCRDRE